MIKEFPKAITQDYNNNGTIDTWYIDTNNNGKIDFAFLDDNEDGKVEAVLIDENENEVWEATRVDEDQDGKIDYESDNTTNTLQQQKAKKTGFSFELFFTIFKNFFKMQK